MMSNKIKILIMDVDGTLTDGKIYIGSNGELMKAFDVKDGLMITKLREYNIEPVIITGRESEITLIRSEELGISEIHQGVKSKVSKLIHITEKFNCSLEEVAYISDDLNDLDCILISGVSGCPADVVKEIKDNVNFVCTSKGGNGAVREFIEYLINNYR